MIVCLIQDNSLSYAEPQDPNMIAYWSSCLKVLECRSVPTSKNAEEAMNFFHIQIPLQHYHTLTHINAPLYNVVGGVGGIFASLVAPATLLYPAQY